jgi:hypothetical protein
MTSEPARREDNPNCADTFASLRLFGDELQPDQVTSLLGVGPTDSAPKGLVVVSSTGKERRAPTGRWVLSSEGQVASRDLQQHIEWLLKHLNGYHGSLLELPGVRSADVFCYWLSATGNGGPELSPEVLRWLAARGLTLGFDLYFQSD